MIQDVDKNVRREVHEFLALGPFSPSGTAQVDQIEQHEKRLHAIGKPVTDEEARLLVHMFGEDDYFGLAFALMHLIETAPGWPIKGCLKDESKDWIQRLRVRAINGGYSL